MPTVYVSFLLFFPTAEADPHRVERALFMGFEKLLQAMPILTCSITEPMNGPQKGALAATLPRRAAAQVWRVKDFRAKEDLKYPRLREARFPISRFPLWDFTTLPFLFDADPPALHAQVTLIDGGLVMAMCVHHSLADGTGCNVIARALATCCRGEKLDPQDIARVWARPSILESEEKVQSEDFSELKTHTRTHVMSKRPPAPGLVLYLRRKLQAYYNPVFNAFVMALTKYQALSQSTRMIHFPKSSLNKLKETARDSRDVSEREGWLSSLDVLTTLMFCCITESRLNLKRGPFTPVSSRKKAHVVTFLRGLLTWLYAILFPQSQTSSFPLSKVTALLLTAVNLRKACHPPVPPDYIGNLFLICNVDTPVLDLLPTVRNISSLAHRLRARRKEMDSGYVGRVVSAIRSAPDVSKLGFSGGEFPELCLLISSWREQDHCRLDWGSEVGVRCERVRTCEFIRGGVAIVFPEAAEMEGGEDGGLDVALSLEKGVMKELERNPVFNQFARWR